MAIEIDAKVIEIIQRNYNVKSVRLDVGKRVEFQAGQFMCVTLKSDPACKRYLSISNSPTEEGYIEFTKKLTQSDFSRALEALKPGDILHVKYPMGKFTLNSNDKKIAFLSGGIGITPIRSMCRFAVDNKLDVDIVLLYSNRTFDDIVFRQDFELMQKYFSKLKVVHILCEAAGEFRCKIGRIDAETIHKEAPDFAERKFYLCGPPPMVEAMKNILLLELQLPVESIITENFQGYE